MNIAQQSMNSQIAESDHLYNSNTGIYMDIRTIFPAEAKEILAGQIKNRKLSQLVIQRYARQMAAGNWKINGETITFGNGMLIDGQHRLHACIRADKPLKVIYVVLDNHEAFNTIDSGKRRNVSDVFSINGLKRTTTLAAALAVLVKIDNTGEITAAGGGRSARIENHECEELLRNYPNLDASCTQAQRWYKHLKIKTTSVAVLNYLLRRAEGKVMDDESTTLADKFLDKVFYGENLTKNNPAMVLRNSFIRHVTCNAQPETRYILKAGISCWENWLKGVEINRISVRSDSAILKPAKPTINDIIRHES
tara:strand:+ start:28 stop:954 length:927 start_codon:yes stop_codon:yes gene_type:complete